MKKKIIAWTTNHPWQSISLALVLTAILGYGVRYINIEDDLMKMLSEEMEGLTILSVGHRPELEQFHSRKLTLERKQGGAKLVSDILLVRPPGQPRLMQRFLRRSKPKPKSKAA